MHIKINWGKHPLKYSTYVKSSSIVVCHFNLFDIKFTTVKYGSLRNPFTDFSQSHEYVSVIQILSINNDTESAPAPSYSILSSFPQWQLLI